VALRLDEIRALADRVAASHGLAVVDVEYLGGGGKHRTLRVFIEKNAEERGRLRERVSLLLERRARREEPDIAEGTRGEPGPQQVESEQPGGYQGEPADEVEGGELEPDSYEDPDGEPGEAVIPYSDEDADEAFLAGLPSVTNLELLSGITHGDCEAFSQDFGTVLDVQELVPGTEYLLEVSSPGLDRRLAGAADYRRFTGSLVKLQTFEPVAGNRHWQGRIAELEGDRVVLELGGKPERRKAKKSSALPPPSRIEIALANVEKAHLVPEF
jgi:ribosome maturation factor RimP